MICEYLTGPWWVEGKIPETLNGCPQYSISCLCVCLSVHARAAATGHIFWPRHIIFGLSDPFKLLVTVFHIGLWYLGWDVHLHLENRDFWRKKLRLKGYFFRVFSYFFHILWLLRYPWNVTYHFRLFFSNNYDGNEYIIGPTIFFLTYERGLVLI